MLKYLFKKIYHLAPKYIQEKPYMYLYRDYIPLTSRTYLRELKARLPWYVHPVLMHSRHYYLSDKNLNRWLVIQSLQKDSIRRFGTTYITKSKYQCFIIKLKILIRGEDSYSL